MSLISCSVRANFISVACWCISISISVAGLVSLFFMFILLVNHQGHVESYVICFDYVVCLPIGKLLTSILSEFEYVGLAVYADEWLSFHHLTFLIRATPVCWCMSSCVRLSYQVPLRIRRSFPSRRFRVSHHPILS